MSFLIPKTEPYFTRLSRMAIFVHEAGELFDKLFDDWGNRKEYADRIKALEKQCDDIVDNVIEKLNTSFITPIDREDIHLLVTELDNIIDFMNGLGRKFDMYGIKKPRPEAKKMAYILKRCTIEIKGAFQLLEEKQKVGDHVKSIHDLENEADQIYREAITTLFQKEKNPIEVVRWNAIFEAMEDSIDRCKDLASILESVVVKNR